MPRDETVGSVADSYDPRFAAWANVVGAGPMAGGSNLDQMGTALDLLSNRLRGIIHGLIYIGDQLEPPPDEMAVLAPESVRERMVRPSDSSVHNYEGPGLYRHWKGSVYEVLGLSLAESQLGHPENQPEVVYRRETPGDMIGRFNNEPVSLYRRPWDIFNQHVWVESPDPDEGFDSWVPRFKRVG